MTQRVSQGFVLTRQWFDHPKRGLIFVYWLASEQGPVCLEFDQQHAVLFIRRVDKTKVAELLRYYDAWTIKDVALQDFSLEPVCAVYCQSYQRFLDIRKILQRHDIKSFESDVLPCERYLMERFITAGVTFSAEFETQQLQFDAQTSVREYPLSRQAKIKACEYRPTLKALSIDIETSIPLGDELGELYSIGVYSADISLVLMVGDQENISYRQYFKTETELLQVFMRLVHEYDPDVMMGWSVVNFDFHFMQAKCDALGIKFRLGRGGETPTWRKNAKSHKQFMSVAGRVVLDGIDTLKQAMYHFESFSLEFVSQTLLNKGKDIQPTQHRGNEITRLYQNDHVAFARYNLEDCRLVFEIFKQQRLMEFAIERSLLTGHSLDRVGGSVAAFEYQYLPRLHRMGFVAPNLGDGMQRNDVPGGYVMDSEPGLYRNVIVLDFKSLYPSIIRTFLIDPAGLILGQQESAQGLSIVPGFNQAQFSRLQHLLPDIIERLWQARDEAKRAKDTPLSQAIKILMNSFYGVLGSTGCRFYDARLSSSITMRGHEILQKTRTFIEAQGYRVIYGDTDSVFVFVQDPHAQVDAIGKQLVKNLNAWWKNYLQETYQLKSHLELEYETHYQQFLMPTIRGSEKGSKKRYAGVVGQQGETQLVFKGLETVRTDWTRLAKVFQKELYQKIFLDEPYCDYIKARVSAVYAGKFDDVLVYRKRLGQAPDDYVKNIPPHVQAARKLNRYLQHCNPQAMLRRGDWSEYVVTINGPEPVHPDLPISSPDYEHYIEKQLLPVADSILHFKGQTFEEIVTPQQSLF